MESIESFFQRSTLSILTATGIFCSAICPAIAFIFIFKQEIFSSLDNIKLLILCAVLSTPIWVVNFYLVSKIEKFKQSATINKLAIVTSIVSLFPLYFPAFIRIFFEGLTTGQGLNIAIALELGIVFLLVRENWIKS